MLRYIFALIVFVHGVIHLLGFLKSFKLATISQLTTDIPKATGILWLLASLLIISTSIIFLLQKDWWWILAITAFILSQSLIISEWKDSKAGTMTNLIV